MKKSAVHITDHAVLRYLERALLMDIESLRRRIGREIDARMIDDMPTPTVVAVNGVRFKLKGSTVTTCVVNSQPRIKRWKK